MNTGHSDIPVIFDRRLIKKNRLRALKTFSDHDFLFQWAQNQLSDRLLDINRTFETALHIGSRVPTPRTHPKIQKLFILDPPPICTRNTSYIRGDEEFLPIRPKSLDLIISTLNLHTVNDLPGTLIQIRQSLKDDGLFMGAMLGGETLYEFRDVLMKAELELFKGISPHIFPFADKQQIGSLLQRTGFALPVIDSEIITVTYDSIFKLMHDLRGMGEGNVLSARRKQYMGRKFFMRAEELYHEIYPADEGRIKASFEILFMIGWAPHPSQQKPLRPGSADHSLAEALGAHEEKLD